LISSKDIKLESKSGKSYLSKSGREDRQITVQKKITKPISSGGWEGAGGNNPSSLRRLYILWATLYYLICLVIRNKHLVFKRLKQDSLTKWPITTIKSVHVKWKFISEHLGKTKFCKQS